MANFTTTQPFGDGISQRALLTQADATAQSKGGGARLKDRSVQVFGTFGGATVTISGSNEEVPENWAVLHDATGADLVISAAGIEVVAENCLHVQAALTGAPSGSTNLTVIFGGRM